MQNKISLGTVQFGLDYGISNPKGKVSFDKVQSIIDSAKEYGIDTIDTASAYGNSEEVLGKINTRLENSNIISKFSGSNLTVEEEVKVSLERLKQKSIYGYLAHSFNIMSDSVYEQLVTIQEIGYVEKIGVSLYHPEEVDTIIEKYPKLDLVQIPYSVFDQRFNEKLLILSKNNITIHSRSAFLQGLVFMDPLTLPKYLNSAVDNLKKLRNISEQYKIPINILAFYFVLKNKFINKVVIGVTSKEELEDNIIGLLNFKINSDIFSKLKDLAIQDENIILPYNWNKK